LNTSDIDVVSVYHKDENYNLFLELEKDLERHEGGRVNLIGVDNREHNRGFSKACNLGSVFGRAPVIGFINPDAKVLGSFVPEVLSALRQDGVVITGERYGKHRNELAVWGVKDWVCGACFFVKRDFFEKSGGFDEQFVWGWEETDLIRRAEAQGLACRSIRLPIKHSSPAEDTPSDAAYKNKYFNDGARRFYRKWPRTM
jgi:GT2 family glycosyltransferase